MGKSLIDKFMEEQLTNPVLALVVHGISGVLAEFEYYLKTHRQEFFEEIERNFGVKITEEEVQ